MSLQVKKAKVPLDNSETEFVIRYIITEDYIPLAEVNRWLDLNSFNSYLTGARYAYAMLTYLRFLKQLNIHYREVTNKKTIEHYVKYLMGYSGEEVVDFEGKKSINSIKFHISVVKNFYNWLEDNGEIESNPVKYGNQKNKQDKRFLKTKFLYGQIWDFNIDENQLTKKLKYKEKRDHIKWYTQEQIQEIIKHLPTQRDKVIFRISIETGMRIGEILGLREIDFDSFEKILRVRRHLNVENESLAKTMDRDLPISDSLVEDIENYIRAEYIPANVEFSPYLFINLQGPYKGKPLKRRNFLRILKSAANKCGLDTKKIRTHSGRSTKAQTLVELLYEGKISEQIILDIMGWSSSDTLKHYTDKASSKQKLKTVELLSYEKTEDSENC